MPIVRICFVIVRNLCNKHNCIECVEKRVHTICKRDKYFNLDSDICSALADFCCSIIDYYRGVVS